jgi:hypothetical protein
MPERADDRESLSLPETLTHVLDECRMVLPGIQALFGFQMIAVFNNGFAEKLSESQQKLHIFAIVLVVLAIGMLMAPAALHREAEPRQASGRFIRVSSRLLVAAMVPLAAAICIDVHIVTTMVWHDPFAGAFASIALFVFLSAIWFVFPRWYRGQR